MNGGILFLSHRQPYPPNRGDSIRSWNILKALSKLAPVHLVSFGEGEPETHAMLNSVCASVSLIPQRRSKVSAAAAALLSGRAASVEMFRSKQLSEEIRRVISTHAISLVYAFSGQMGQYAEDLPPGLGFVMDFTDVDSEKFASYGRTAGGVAALANRMEARRLLSFEHEIARKADASLFVSASEEQLFRRVTRDEALVLGTLENGVDLDLFKPGAGASDGPVCEAPLIVFTGQMDYPPNVDAVSYFAREVLPLVRARQADARFAIVGRAPTPAVLALAELPGVMVTGAVPDTRPWLDTAKVVVAPLRIARGIQNKVLEAMAMGKAVVASPEAAEGIDACHGREFIIAGSAAGQADAVVALLHDAARRTRMQQDARAAMEARYSWEAKLAILPQFVDGADQQAAA